MCYVWGRQRKRRHRARQKQKPNITFLARTYYTHHSWWGRGGGMLSTEIKKHVQICVQGKQKSSSSSRSTPAPLYWRMIIKSAWLWAKTIGIFGLICGWFCLAIIVNVKSFSLEHSFLRHKSGRMEWIMNENISLLMCHCGPYFRLRNFVPFESGWFEADHIASFAPVMNISCAVWVCTIVGCQVKWN